jgi:transposase
VLMKSLVRKTLGVKDHKILAVEMDSNRLLIVLERKQRRQLPCSRCGCRSPVYDRLPARAWRHVPLWGYSTELVYAPSRVNCPHCGVKVERIPWSEGKSRLTTPLVILLAEWSKDLALEKVAEKFQVSWATVASAVQQAVAYGVEHRDLSGLRHLGVDELSRRKGHIYHTQIYDLDRNRLLESVPERKAASLEQFVETLEPACAQRIRAVCCDMWEPYVQVIQTRLPQATLVFDKFHLVKHLNEAVDQVRKGEAAELKATNPDLLKGAKYLFLKNPWNLTPSQKQRLGALEKLNLKVSRAYLLKELFRDFFRYTVKGWAARYLRQWFWWATHSRLKPMRDFAWLLRRHEQPILAWHDCRINNGAVEALNNVAKAISHRCHGFRTAKWFRLVLLLGMGDLPMPQFAHKFS